LRLSHSELDLCFTHPHLLPVQQVTEGSTRAVGEGKDMRVFFSYKAGGLG